MTKDRDQLTPVEDDRSKLHSPRSAAREAEQPIDDSTGRGPGSTGSDPPARDVVAGSEEEKYSG